MGKPLQISGNIFGTKKEAEDFTRTILYKYHYDQPLQDHDLDFVLGLLERHPTRHPFSGYRNGYQRSAADYDRNRLG